MRRKIANIILAASLILLLAGLFSVIVKGASTGGRELPGQASAEVTAESTAAAVAEEEQISDYEISDDLFSSLARGFRMTFLDPVRRGQLFRGLLVTILLTAVTALIGLITGTALFVWEYSDSRHGGLIAEWFGAFMDYVPKATLLIIIFYIFLKSGSKDTAMVSLVALSLCFCGSCLTDLQWSFDEISKGEYEAAVTMGYGKLQALRKVFLPAMMPMFLSRTRDSMINHIQNTALVELISVLDIQTAADLIASETGEPFFPLLFTTAAYVLISLGSARILSSLKMQFDVKKSEDQIMDRIRKGAF